MAAFRATLEEVLAADLILHVRDISHPDSLGQAREVETILASLGVASDTPMLEVWNKIDRVPDDMRDVVVERGRRDPDVMPVSALTGMGMADLLDAIAIRLGAVRHLSDLTIPFAEGRRRAWLHAEGVVETEEQTDDGFRLRVFWTDRQEKRWRDL